jgi:iron complex transport system permease protein
MNLRSYSITLLIFFLLFITTLCITPLIGSSEISLARAFSSTLTISNNVDANILFQVRLPRILLGALTGAALSVAGAIFQALLRNDLAAPFTLGVSSGAALGAVIAIALNLNFAILGFSIISLFSFVGSLGAIFLVFSLVRTRHGEFPTAVLLLAGITANFFFAAMVMFVHYMADFSQSFRIIRWLMGGLDITDYKTILSVCPVVFVGIFILMFISRDINLISTGVQSASSRGVNVGRIQKVGFITASLITGTVVATCGPIAFVGLIVPHIVRLFVGPDLRLLIPTSILFGGSFLIICDTFARTLLAPTEIPVGIITAMLGGPFFIWLLKRKRPV